MNARSEQLDLGQSECCYGSTIIDSVYKTLTRKEVIRHDWV